MRYWLAPLAVWLALALPGVSHADQKDPHLDDLFKQLATVDDEQAARGLESRIWEIWSTPSVKAAKTPYSVAVNFMGEGLLASARDAFTEVIEIAPDFAEAYNKRATVLFYMGDYTASIADIQRTLALEPRHFGAMSGLAMITDVMGRYEVALGALARIKKMYPAMPGLDERIRNLEEALHRKRI